jgi:hypothetical protein
MALAVMVVGCGFGSSMDLPVINRSDGPRTFYLVDLADGRDLGTYAVPAGSWGVIHGLPVPRHQGLEMSVYAADCSVAGTTGIPPGTPADVIVLTGAGQPALGEISESRLLDRVELAAATGGCK